MALCKTAQGWQDDSVAPCLPAPDDSAYQQAKGLQEQKEDAAVWGSGSLQRQYGLKGYQSQEDIERMRGKSAQAVAAEQAAAERYKADRMVEAARARAARGYAAGGAVKNDHPFNKSFDNKLLMKSNRR